MSDAELTTPPCDSPAAAAATTTTALPPPPPREKKGLHTSRLETDTTSSSSSSRRRRGGLEVPDAVEQQRQIPSFYDRSVASGGGGGIGGVDSNFSCGDVTTPSFHYSNDDDDVDISHKISSYEDRSPPPRDSLRVPLLNSNGNGRSSRNFNVIALVSGLIVACSFFVAQLPVASLAFLPDRAVSDRRASNIFAILMFVMQGCGACRLGHKADLKGKRPVLSRCLLFCIVGTFISTVAVRNWVSENDNVTNQAYQDYVSGKLPQAPHVLPVLYLRHPATTSQKNNDTTTVMVTSAAGRLESNLRSQPTTLPSPFLIDEPLAANTGSSSSNSHRRRVLFSFSQNGLGSYDWHEHLPKWCDIRNLFLEGMTATCSRETRLAGPPSGMLLYSTLGMLHFETFVWLLGGCITGFACGGVWAVSIPAVCDLAPAKSRAYCITSLMISQIFAQLVVRIAAAILLQGDPLLSQSCLWRILSLYSITMSVIVAILVVTLLKDPRMKAPKVTESPLLADVYRHLTTQETETAAASPRNEEAINSAAAAHSRVSTRHQRHKIRHAPQQLKIRQGSDLISGGAALEDDLRHNDDAPASSSRGDGDTECFERGGRPNLSSYLGSSVRNNFQGITNTTNSPAPTNNTDGSLSDDDTVRRTLEVESPPIVLRRADSEDTTHSLLLSENSTKSTPSPQDWMEVNYARYLANSKRDTLGITLPLACYEFIFYGWGVFHFLLVRPARGYETSWSQNETALAVTLIIFLFSFSPMLWISRLITKQIQVLAAVVLTFVWFGLGVSLYSADHSMPGQVNNLSDFIGASILYDAAFRVFLIFLGVCTMIEAVETPHSAVRCSVLGRCLLTTRLCAAISIGSNWVFFDHASRWATLMTCVLIMMSAVVITKELTPTFRTIGASQKELDSRTAPRFHERYGELITRTNSEAAARRRNSQRGGLHQTVAELERATLANFI